MPTDSRRRTLAIAMIVCATFLVYANSLRNLFVLDDYGAILNNAFIRDWHNLPKLFSREYLSSGGENLMFGVDTVKSSGELTYRPVATFSYFVLHALWGSQPFGYHFSNVLLHSANAVLLFFFCRTFFQKGPVPLMSALLFAVHPANAEVINCTSFNEDSLCLFFMLGGLIAHARFCRHGRPRAVAVAAACFVLAFFSKETGFMAPFVAALYDYLFEARSWRGVLLRIRAYAAYAAAMIFCVTVSFFLMAADSRCLIPRGSLGTFAKALAQYASWALLPLGLTPPLVEDPHLVAHTFWSIDVLFSAALTLVLLFAVFYWRKKRPVYTFGIAYFFIVLAPIFPLSFRLVAAHYLYLPLPGLLWVLAGVIAELGGRKKVFLARAAFAAFWLFFASMTVLWNIVWKDDVSMASELVARRPTHPGAHSALAYAYLRLNLWDEAINECRAALALDPVRFQDYVLLGKALYAKGRYDDAIYFLNEALRHNPGSSYACLYLASAFQASGQLSEAERVYRKALQLDGRNAEAWNGVAVFYAKQGRYDEAKSAIDKALEIRPDYERAASNREKIAAGMAASRQG